MEIKNKNKILIITNSSEKGGEAVFISNLADEIKKNFSYVEVLSFLDKGEFCFNESATKKTFMSPTYIFGKPIPTIKDLLLFSKKISEFDVVYNFVFNLHSVLFALISFVNRKKIVSTFHTNLSDRNSNFLSLLKIFLKFFIVNFILIFSDYLIFITNHQKESFRRYCFSKKSFDLKSKVFFYPNFYFLEKRAGLPQNNRFSVVFVGRLTKEKGFDTFLSIALDPDFESLDFHIVGDGVMKKDIPKKINIFSYGEIDNLQTQKVIKNSDVLLFPTRNETFGLVILEAMSKGVIILTSLLPEIKEKISGNLGVFLFKPGDIKNIKENLVHIINYDKKDLMQMSEANIGFIRDNMEDVKKYINILTMQ